MAGPMRTDELTAVKPPRPPNSWILYRAHVLKNLPPPGPGEPRRSQSDVSALVSNMWKHEAEHIKAHFERLAEEAKAQHKVQFPGYRYRPKKKEEKERLRELQKQQKEAQKSAKKTRRVDKSVEPSVLPSSRSFLMPGAPYYNPHVLYSDRVGPSPPLSASSSPCDAIPSPIVLPSPIPPSTRANEAALKPPPPPDTTASSSSTVPPLTLPALDTLVHPQSLSEAGSSLLYLSSSGQVDATENNEANWQPENHAPLAEDLFSNVDPAQDSWDNTIFNPNEGQSTASGSLLFELPPGQLTWLQNETQAYDGQAGPSAPSQGDAIYRLDNFDPAILSLDPTGEVEVSLGNLPPFHDSSFFETLFPANNDFMSSMPQLDPDPNSFGMNNNDFTSLFFNFSDPYPPEEVPTVQPTSEPPTQVQEEAASSSSYTPPSGAAYSSNRRVGANWANSIYTREELLPRSPPVHAN